MVRSGAQLLQFVCMLCCSQYRCRDGSMSEHVDASSLISCMLLLTPAAACWTICSTLVESKLSVLICVFLCRCNRPSGEWQEAKG